MGKNDSMLYVTWLRPLVLFGRLLQCDLLCAYGPHNALGR